MKKLPMSKDPVFMAKLREEVLRDHNKKIAKLRAKGKLPPK
jgi:hypothetical protein